MHLTRETVTAAVLGAASDISAMLPAERRVAIDGSSDVLGSFDSLSALNLLLRIEERLCDAAGVPVDLVGGDGADDMALLRARTLDDLSAAVSALLERAGP